MSCPTCDHTMTPLGCKVTDGTFHWCPRCGTIKPCQEEEAVAPVLIDRCRDFESVFSEPVGQMLWNKLGIREAINVPADRGSNRPPKPLLFDHKIEEAMKDVGRLINLNNGQSHEAEAMLCRIMAALGDAKAV